MCDVAELSRASASFYRRCFTDEEIAYCEAQPAPAQHFAARFAAKEAAVKALSRVTNLAYWQIEVTRDEAGAPGLRIWDEARQALLDILPDQQLLVSLTHTDTTAAAIVVVSPRRT
jgi:phosphopantetheine--protein transferase-like protein